MPFAHLFPPRPGARTIAALAAALATASPAWAATECVNVPCQTVCSPDPPVVISTLVPPSEFPEGIQTPVAFVDPDEGRDRRLIATQEGTILVWEGENEAILPTFFLDLRDDVGGPVIFLNERGLLALAADPDYRENGRFYVLYTRADLGPDTLGDVVLARYERSAGNPDVADPASATEILVIEHSARPNHNGGWLAFGPDGLLYVSIGDGGGGCDGNLGIDGDGQRPDTLLGKILRIDVRGVDAAGGPPDDCGIGAGNYTVPSTNPFFGQEPACDEVWAMGMRNPFRFSFDRLTGDLYIGDVGQKKWEEIDVITASAPAPVNFGWPCREACETSANAESVCEIPGCPDDTGTTCEFPRASGYQDAVLCHHNPGWAAIMGGYRYRGELVPALDGDYLYGDAYCGQIWKTTVLDPSNPAAIDSECWASGYQGLYGFSEDHLGELYLVLGAVSRIDCIHAGDGCFWAGWEIFDDGFEQGDAGRWSLAVP